jgi:SAM-dependent methyltransferase
VEAAAYDELGRGYSAARRTDPRIAARLREALGNARSVVNVGAGTGCYEPTGLELTAVEPSATMIAQRPAASAPVVQARAEALPFDDDSFDAAIAILTDHHWSDRAAGLRELRRVARDRVILLNADPAEAERFWLSRDYLPGFAGLIPPRYRQPGHWLQEFRDSLGRLDVQPVPVPHDCHDGFYQAFWRRPAAYLDQEMRDGTSVFRLLPEAEVAEAVRRLGEDLESGAWSARYADLHGAQELDVGLRLVVAGSQSPE